MELLEILEQSDEQKQAHLLAIDNKQRKEEKELEAKPNQIEQPSCSNADEDVVPYQLVNEFSLNLLQNFCLLVNSANHYLEDLESFEAGSFIKRLLGLGDLQGLMQKV